MRAKKDMRQQKTVDFDDKDEHFLSVEMREEMESGIAGTKLSFIHCWRPSLVGGPRLILSSFLSGTVWHSSFPHSSSLLMSQRTPQGAQTRMTAPLPPHLSISLSILRQMWPFSDQPKLSFLLYVSIDHRLIWTKAAEFILPIHSSDQHPLFLHPNNCLLLF